MFPYYSRPQSYHSPYYHPSQYARAVAQQQQLEQQRARALAQQQQLEEQRARAYAKELQRQRASRYIPQGYDYDPQSDDDEDDYYGYLTPHQRALFEAKRRQDALEQRKREEAEAARLAHERALQARAEQLKRSQPVPSSPSRRMRSVSPTTLNPSSQRMRSVSPGATSPPTPAPAAHRTPSPVPASPSPSPSPELLNEAATKIQNQYRIHRALRTISELAAKFEKLKTEFVTPATIDFQADGGHIVSVPVLPTAPSTSTIDAAAPASAKLAFTPTNVPLHTYAELLSRLLVSLDGVDSRGDKRVRERRREVVRAVEGEAARLEAWWRSVWEDRKRGEEQKQDGEEDKRPDGEEDEDAMVVDEPEAESVPELSVSAESEEEEEDAENEFVTPPATPLPAPRVLKDDEDFVMV